MEHHPWSPLALKHGTWASTDLLLHLAPCTYVLLSHRMMAGGRAPSCSNVSGCSRTATSRWRSATEHQLATMDVDVVRGCVELLAVSCSSLPWAPRRHASPLLLSPRGQHCGLAPLRQLYIAENFPGFFASPEARVHSPSALKKLKQRCRQTSPHSAPTLTAVLHLHLTPHRHILLSTSSHVST